MSFAYMYVWIIPEHAQILFHYSYYAVPFDDFNFLSHYTSTFNFMIDINTLAIS